MRPIANHPCFPFWWNVKATWATSSEVKSLYKVKILVQESKAGKQVKQEGKQKSPFLLHFTSLTSPVPGFQSGHHVTFSGHVSLGASRWWQSLRLSLFAVTLTVLRRAGGQIILHNDSQLEFIWFFPSQFDWGHWILGEKSTEVMCHSQGIPLREHTLIITLR